MRRREGAMERAVGGARAIVAALLVACAAKPVVAPATPATPATPPTTPTEPAMRDPKPAAPEPAAHVIVPADGEAQVGDLVLTALELREEQYDHQPGRGDVLVATLHVRHKDEARLSREEMSQQLPALVRVRSDDGERGTNWNYLRLVVTGGDRSAIVLAVSRIPTAASLGGAALRLDANAGSGTAAGLTVTVLDVVEKRKMEGTSMMRVLLHVRPAGAPAPALAAMQQQEDALVRLTSDPGEDIATWRGYRIGYLGGWRTEVELKVVPPGE
ncbi:MAG: hypothetical protein JNL82_12505 [Myxococcales bacterium]|nr:hypothetical protein [Myxococcales bacterium]